MNCRFIQTINSFFTVVTCFQRSPGTVSDISKTWISETLNSIASKYIRKWLELPVSATHSNALLPQNKFGLNIVLPSTEFIQWQTVSLLALKYSPNEDVKNLWAVTGRYDIYKDTKDVLKAVRKQNEQRLQNYLVSQGSFFRNILENSSWTLNCLWSSAQSKLSKKHF